jgi:hypothetical protein
MNPSITFVTHCNCAYLPLLRNMLKSAKRVGIKQFVVYLPSEDAFAPIEREGLDAVFRPLQAPLANAAVSFGRQGWKELSLIKFPILLQELAAHEVDLPPMKWTV